MVKQIPNIITSLNLLCGIVAVLFVVSGDLVTGAIFMCIGIVFDFFDGLAARMLNAHSEVGLQLDSLADLITSGLVPSLVMVQLLSLSVTGNSFVISDFFSETSWNQSYENYVPLIGLLIAVASAYRLAKFNVDDRQSSSFIGLPTPANSLLIVSLALILKFQSSQWIEGLLLNQWVLIAVTLLSCILLNAEIFLFALKFKTWDVKSNMKRYIFLLVCLVAIITLKFLAIPVIIVFYILLSLLWKDKEEPLGTV